MIILGVLHVWKVAAQDVEQPNPNVKEIIIAFKTHFDNGYTDKSEPVMDKYSTK